MHLPPEAQRIIEALQMLPHPEGGYYAETYRAPRTLVREDGRVRNLFTAIYYLLTPGDCSHFHRLQSDELWFFHSGAPVHLYMLQEGKIVTYLVGNDAGMQPQLRIPAHTWFAAEMKADEGYSLVSCTVSPGFDFEDFEIATHATLAAEGWNAEAIPAKLVL